MSIDHYIPIEEKIHIINGRRVERRTPVLGEYILTSITSIWRSMLRIRGVRGMLFNDLDLPAQVLPDELNRLRAFYGDIRKLENVAPRGFQYGDRVTPREGPFAFHVGAYDGKTRKGDSAVFHLFGREQKVTFKKGVLVAAA